MARTRHEVGCRRLAEALRLDLGISGRLPEVVVLLRDDGKEDLICCMWARNRCFQPFPVTELSVRLTPAQKPHFVSSLNTRTASRTPHSSLNMDWSRYERYLNIGEAVGSEFQVQVMEKSGKNSWVRSCRCWRSTISTCVFLDKISGSACPNQKAQAERRTFARP